MMPIVVSAIPHETKIEAHEDRITIECQGEEDYTICDIWCNGILVRSNYPLGSFETIRYDEFGLTPEPGQSERIYVKMATTDGQIFLDGSVLTPLTLVQMRTPTSTPTPSTPAFEAIFALTGLLAVAYLMRRAE